MNKFSLRNLVKCMYQPNSLHGKRSKLSGAALGISQTKLVRLTGDMPGCMGDFIIEAQLRCRVSFHQLTALLICAPVTLYASNMWSDCVAFLGMGDKCTKMFDDFRDGVRVSGCRSWMLLFYDAGFMLAGHVECCP